MATHLTLEEIRYATYIAPLEKNVFADGSDELRVPHSDLDRSYGSKDTIIAASGDEALAHHTYLTTTSGVSIEAGAGICGDSVVFAIFIIESAGSTGTPDCEISLDGGANWDEKLVGVGDVTIMQIDSIDADTIQVRSTGATTVANIRILAKGEPEYFLDADSKNVVLTTDPTDTTYLRTGD